MAIWKIIEESPKYEVSDEGGIRFLGAFRRFGRHPSIWFPPKELSPCLDTRGYRYVCLACGEKGRLKNKRTHRLVAQAFIPNPLGRPEINHKNGDRQDNRLENLEWVDRQENMLHRTQVLKSGLGEGNGAAKITEEIAVAIISSPDENDVLADRYGLSNAQVRNIRNGHAWAHVKAERVHDKVVKGERQGRSKLTEEAVRIIRASTERTSDLARSFGVSRPVIDGVRKGTLWKHVI